MCSGDMATTVMDTDIVTDRFSRSTVPELKRYLQQRGVTMSGYRKELDVAVHRCQLPVDPDFKGIDPVTAVDDKLKALGIDGNPRTLSGFTTDLCNIPAFGLCDVFNYLLCSRADYDQRKLKAYKSFEDYRLFSDGLVECLEVKENAAVLFAYSERRSALRKKTKLI